MLYGEYVVRKINPKADQRRASWVPGWRKLIDQLPESNNLVKNLPVFIYKSGVYW